MLLLRYLTHPEVEIDPAVPVPQWRLSEVGRSRVQTLADTGWLTGTTRLISSEERKAVETAEILAEPLGLPVEKHTEMGENDRSATGYVPPERFRKLADRFFAHPYQQVEGWESAADAQARIVRTFEEVLHIPPEGHVLIVGHGGVGTLLFCHLAGLPISAAHDQPEGGGCYFTMALDDRRVLHPWRRIEDPAG